jgi:SOS-response transcriptional repressor LexA
MHSVQRKIVAILRDQGAVPLKYREIGRRIGEKYPQTVKHHLESLINRKMVLEVNGMIKLNNSSVDPDNADYFNLPFFGLASCGEATCIAEDLAEGYLRISRKVLPSIPVNNIFLLRASGNSMNEAKIGIHRQNIEDGDFVIVDSTKKNPYDNDYIVSIIEGCANIKKYRYSPELKQVQLLSESSDEYLPIILHESDNFYVAGKVIAVIKKIDTSKEKYT